MRLNVIVAMALNHVIGNENRMPWHLPADFAWFKRQTMGHPVIMGRRTFESIGRPLPGRRNIVLTGRRDWEADGVEVAPSLPEALARCSTMPEVFIIGGATLYREALPIANRLFLTIVEATMEGDASFPAWNPQEWQETFCQRMEPDARNAHGMQFHVLERISMAKPSSC